MLDADRTELGRLFQAIGPKCVLAEVSACSGNDQIIDCSRTEAATGVVCEPATLRYSGRSLNHTNTGPFSYYVAYQNTRDMRSGIPF